jgi:hypothetical protein
VALGALACGSQARAETAQDVAAQVAKLQQQVDAQAAQIASQQDENAKLKSLSAQLLEASRGTGEPAGAPAPITIAQGPTVTPSSPPAPASGVSRVR